MFLVLLGLRTRMAGFIGLDVQVLGETAYMESVCDCTERTTNRPQTQIHSRESKVKHYTV